ncbi:HAD-IIB family hydrolase [Patescibacteria group bacterium]|nr:HAD-IIB family hydrolase [Patescibacteria group bacterium]MDE1944217.1 HAD-IIB family hydrolase [Patescibacteria group bacterium]MDE1945488.1 HAD-IIB family hydrolase [Patescibacteria group bacterium]
MPKLIFFDLDGTLAESKAPIGEEMAALLEELLRQARVCVVSGGALSQFEKQVVARLPEHANLGHLYLEPTSGAALYEWQNGLWHKVYEERLSPAQVTEIEGAMRIAGTETGLIDWADASHGERVENRGGQVSLSALGQKAPLALKREWDPDKAKRRALRDAIAKRLPAYAVHMGGLTTIDVNRAGVDKAYGIHQLCERLHVAEADALYVGDELEAGGNDEAAFRTGVNTRAVASPRETAAVIRELLAKG